MAVVGYPIGGDTISVTSGVVSRIEVTSYVHGSTELLGVQIDAAINSGNSGTTHLSHCLQQPALAAWSLLLVYCSGISKFHTHCALGDSHINLTRVIDLVTGGPVFNEVGECVGIAFQSLSGSDAENIGYVIPTPVIQHFLTDFRYA